MSDTPETDAEAEVVSRPGYTVGNSYVPSGYVRADFARRLERERDEARRYCGCLEEQLDETGLRLAQRQAGMEPNPSGEPAHPTQSHE